MNRITAILTNDEKEKFRVLAAQNQKTLSKFTRHIITSVISMTPEEFKKKIG